MAQIETWLNQDMMQAVKVKYLDGNLFSQDNAGNLIGVKLTRDGVDYSGGGTVSANVIRSDGGTVAVTGALSGNVATVVLPQAAYSVPGVVSIVVKLTVSGEVATIAAVVANIYQSSTETAIDPGTIIPSIQTLINQINTAIASIPADYSSLWTSLAPAFSTSTAYTAGQYVTNNGGVYRFTTDHPAGAWSSSDVSAVVFGNELLGLKNAIKFSDKGSAVISGKSNEYGFSDSDWEYGSIANDGFDIVNPQRIRSGYIPVFAYTGFTVSVSSGYKFRLNYYDADKNKSDPSYVGWQTSAYTVNSLNRAKYLRIVLSKEPDADISISDYVNCTLTFVVPLQKEVNDNFTLTENKFNILTAKSSELSPLISGWEYGGLNSIGGENNGVTNRIRTGYIPVYLTCGFDIECDPAYEMYIQRFDRYKEFHDVLTWTNSYAVSSFTWLGYIRIAIRNKSNPEADMSLSDGSNVTATYSTIQTKLENDVNSLDGVYPQLSPIRSNNNKIPANSNLNDFVNAGSYYVSSDKNTISNLPLFDGQTYNGVLYVISLPSSAICQLYIATPNNMVALRNRTNATTWGDWNPAGQAIGGNLVNVNTIIDGVRIIAQGAEYEQSDYYSTPYLSVDSSLTYFVNVGKVDVFEFSENSISTFIQSNRYFSPGIISLNSNTKYVRLTTQYGFASKEDFVFASADRSFVTNDAIRGEMIALNKFYQMPPSAGVANFMASANHFMNIKWTPVAPIPVIHNYDVQTPKIRVIPAGEEQTGLPYSSTRDVKKYIGSDLSFYTWMSALQNPRSVLYTRIIKAGTIGATYYGVVCDQYASYCLGYYLYPYVKSREILKNSEVVQPDGVRPGDLLIFAHPDQETRPNNSGHTQIIQNVYHDAYGRVNVVEVWEVVNTFPLKHTMSFNQFKRHIAAGQGEGCPYTLCRYKGIDGVPYTPNDFVKGFPDEVLGEVVYPDIMPEYGDCATVEAGTDVVINVINARSYTSINIYKDDALIDTKTSITDFTMQNMAYGMYKFELTDGTDTSYSTLLVADVHGTYDSSTGEITFSSANSIPVYAESYAGEHTDGTFSGVQNKCHTFTDEEIVNGTANVSDLVGPKYPNIRIMFRNEYGCIKWDSHPLSDQWEYWSPS